MSKRRCKRQQTQFRYFSFCSLFIAREQTKNSPKTCDRPRINDWSAALPPLLLPDRLRCAPFTVSSAMRARSVTHSLRFSTSPSRCCRFIRHDRRAALSRFARIGQATNNLHKLLIVASFAGSETTHAIQGCLRSARDSKGSRDAPRCSRTKNAQVLGGGKR